MPLTASVELGGKWTPYVAVAAFTGIRSAELLVLPADCQRDGTILVGGEQAKMRRRRLVEIHPTLQQWLDTYPLTGRYLCPVRGQHNQSVGMSKIRAKAGITQWPQNALRHSFATYHLAAYENAPKTALMLGHRGCDMLWQHYRALATKAQGDAWFNATPTACQSTTILQQLS